MLEFRSVDRNNFRDILKLSVGEGQEHFVATNAYSLSQAKAQPECVPFASYDGETLVGFCMYGMDVGDREYWIYRLMIDRAYQSRGYGREALSLLLERLQADCSHPVSYTHLDVYKRQTYGELQQATMQMCTWLRAQGVKRGESVALQLPFCFELIMLCARSSSLVSFSIEG